MSDHVHGVVDVVLIRDPEVIAKTSDSPKNKPYMRLTFPDGKSYAITTNIGEMIGGAAKGLREWHEAQTKI